MNTAPVTMGAMPDTLAAAVGGKCAAHRINEEPARIDYLTSSPSNYFIKKLKNNPTF